MRTVVRTLIAVLLAGFCPVLVAASVQASAQETQQRSSITNLAASRTLTISIESVSPQFATASQTVTVSGTLSNHTGSAMSDIAVQLQSYPAAFATRSDMETYSGGGPVTLDGMEVGLLQEGNPDQLPGSLANGASARWTVSFDPAPDGATPGFGVYPLEVQATSAASAYTATDRTFLPYWPGKGATMPLPKPLQIAWVWPLIDTPQQGACPQVLATPSLAGSLAAGGRLSTLLSIGAKSAARDDLTWAIDPALLSDAIVMTQPYLTGGDAECHGRTKNPASAAAASWLASLRTGTAGEPAFATPYADVDVSALSHAGLNADLRTAYQVGDAEASQVLPDTFGGKGGGSGTDGGGTDGGGTASALPVAWPAGGTADAGVLSSLASDGGIKTVVLSSSELPTSAPYYDNALARTTSSTGTPMSVLLADSTITGILGSASPASTTASQFAVTQDFLAQTAMILAQAPNVHRSLVIAPPAGWDPSAAEATDLLRLTKAAPWLRTTGLGTLAAETARVSAERLPARQVSKAELSDGYLDKIQALDADLALFKNLLYQPSAAELSSLDAAVAVTESSAWRGGGSTGGSLAVDKLTTLIHDLEREVTIIASKKVLLAGTSGNIAVSVRNNMSVQNDGLSFPVRVRVEASVPAGSSLQPGSAALLTVYPGESLTSPIPLRSTAIGTTTMRLELATSNGSPLPGTAQPMSVEVSRFGRLLLVIIGGALGALVLTTIVRLRRRRRLADGGHDGGADDRGVDRAESRAHAGGTG